MVVLENADDVVLLLQSTSYDLIHWCIGENVRSGKRKETYQLLPAHG